jgi:hypothetical protein
MAVEEHRRIALHRAAAESWGEEVADALMDSIAPSGHELATRQDIDGILTAMDAMDERWDERLTEMDQRWNERFGSMDHRLHEMDQRWDERFGSMDHRLHEMDQRWQAEGRALRAELIGAIDRRVGDAITTQTRILMVSLFVALVAIAGLAFGLN